MSEYPIEGEIIRFGWRVLAAGRNAGAILGIASPEARAAAERITTDRGDRGTERVLRAAYKTGHEIHRLMGFLRFTRDARGRYLARCAPDHFILPGLASHFTRRFGAATWAIIDEKRDLILLGPSGEVPRLFPIKTGLSGNTPLSLVPPAAGTPPQADPWVPQADPWEELWRNYHHAINNEDRKNPGLQRRFMPLRYWKYLPEMNFGASPRGDPCAAPIDTSQKGGP
jgi:probable DNA metabolism protein